MKLFHCSIYKGSFFLMFNKANYRTIQANFTSTATMRHLCVVHILTIWTYRETKHLSLFINFFLRPVILRSVRQD